MSETATAPTTGQLIAADGVRLLSLADAASKETLYAAAVDSSLQAKALEEQAKALKERAGVLRDLCAQRMGPGEAFVHEGSIVFMGTVSEGKATVNTEALERHAELLEPLDLAPKDTRAYPTITAIRKADKALRKAGIHPSALINEAPKVPGLQTRKLEIPDGEE